MEILVLKILSMLYLMVLFGQSFLDKAQNYQANSDWFKSYFNNTIFQSFTTLLLPIITLLEFMVFLSAVLSVVFLFIGSASLSSWTALFALFTFLCLFTGMRVAKDYTGSVNMTVYIIVSLVIFCLCKFGQLNLV